MLLTALSLIAAILAGNGPANTPAEPPPSYQLTVAAAYADVSVTINGFEILLRREEGRRQHALLLNGFLKPEGNELSITVSPAYPGQTSEGHAMLIRYVAGGGGEAVATLYAPGRQGDLALPAEEHYAFDAPGTPALEIWSAEEASLDDAGRAGILAQLIAFQGQVDAELDRRDTRALVALFQALPSNRDAALFLVQTDPEHIADAMIDELAPAVNDQKGMGVVRAPSIRADDLTFRTTGRYVIVGRRDGGPVAGFLFKAGKGLAGLTIDRPVFGFVDGRWIQLQDLKLAR